MLLDAVHNQLGRTNELLQQMLDRLPERPAQERPDGTVELTEPKRPTPAKKAGAGEKREPAGGGPRPAQRRTPKTN
jgi:hypothetical protein